MSSDRIPVITGMAVATPHGFGLEENLTAWRQGGTRFAPIGLFDTTDSIIRYAGEIPGLDDQPLPNRKLKKMVNRKDLLALVTCHAALSDANALEFERDPERSGCFIGACSTQLGDLEPYFGVVVRCVSPDREHFDSELFGRECLGQVNPLAAIKVLMNGSLAHISQAYDLRGPNANLMDFSVSGLGALIAASEAILEGRADFCVVGAMSTPLDPFQVSDVYHQGELLSQDGLDASAIGARLKPYDEARAGTVLSEGAAFLVVESAAHARRRGARALGRVKGFGQAHDGVLDPRPHGASSGLESSLRIAIERSGSRSELGAVYGQGSGSKVQDAVELRTYAAMFNDTGVPITSIKGVTGETSEAHSLLSVIAALDALRSGRTHPTFGFECPPAEARGLALAAEDQRLQGPMVAVTARNAYGNAACVLIGKE